MSASHPLAVAPPAATAPVAPHRHVVLLSHADPLAAAGPVGRVVEGWLDAGHRVTVLTAARPGAAADERPRPGLRIRRAGGSRTAGLRSALRSRRGEERDADLVVEVVDGACLLSPLAARGRPGAALVLRLTQPPSAEEPSAESEPAPGTEPAAEGASARAVPGRRRAALGALARERLPLVALYRDTTLLAADAATADALAGLGLGARRIDPDADDGLEPARPEALLAGGRRRPLRALAASETGVAAGLAAVSLVNNAVQLLFTLVFTRLLGVSGYTALAALIAGFLILYVSGQAVQAAAARSIALSAMAGVAQVRRTVSAWTTRLLLATAAAAGVGVLVREPLASLIGVPDQPWAAASLLAAGAIWVLLSLQRGALQGLRDFTAVGGSILVEGVLRLVLALVLVGAGLGVTGAFLGTPLAFLLTAAVLGWRIRRDASEREGTLVASEAALAAGRQEAAGAVAPAPAPDGPPVGEAAPTATASPSRGRTGLRDLAREERWAILGLLLVAILQNVDTILAKRELDEALAGSYASAAVAAKAVVWVAIGVALHLLPEAARRSAAGGDPHPVLLRAFGIVAIVGVPALLLFAAAPATILGVAFGPEYTAAPATLPLLGLAMTLLAVTLLGVQYLVAVGRRAHLPILAVLAGVEIVVLARPWDSATTFALVVLGVQAAAAAVVVALAWWARPGRRVLAAGAPLPP